MWKPTRQATIAALLSVLGGILGGGGFAWFRYFAIDRPLTAADLTIKNSQIARLSEHLLASQVTVSEAGSETGNGRHRRLFVLLELENVGSQPIQIGNVEFEVLSRRLPPEWDNIRWATPPMRGEFGGGVVRQDDQERNSRVGVINKYAVAHDGWTRAHQWTFDPKEQSGDERAGIILVGQKRHLSFDLLVEDGNTPELLALVLTANPPPEAEATDQHWRQQRVRTLVGVGTLRPYFPLLDIDGVPNPTYPAAPAEAAPMPPAPRADPSA